MNSSINRKHINQRAIQAVRGLILITLLTIANMIIGIQKIHLQFQLDETNHTIELQHAQLQVLQPDAICP